MKLATNVVRFEAIAYFSLALLLICLKATAGAVDLWATLGLALATLLGSGFGARWAIGHLSKMVAYTIASVFAFVLVVGIGSMNHRLFAIEFTLMYLAVFVWCLAPKMKGGSDEKG